jgi:hypothetical protein
MPSQSTGDLAMYVRAPAIRLEEGPLLWSKVLELAMAYNGASIVIPYVECYLNSVMNKVRADNAPLKEELTTFIKQELAPEAIILGHYAKQLTDEQREQSRRRSKQLFRRHLRYLIPRMARVFVPGYDPAKVPMPARIRDALERFKSSSPLFGAVLP